MMNMNKFEFTIPSLYRGITADEAAEELERIRQKHGVLRPELVVDESRDEKSILHGIFQWDDAKAAELYRKEQARKLIDNITVVVQKSEVCCSVRAFVNVRETENGERSYTPVTEAILNDIAYKDLLGQAKSDMESFVTKYAQISELNPVKAKMLEAINM